MNTNEIQANKFLTWINKHYQEQKNKLIAFCNDKHYTFNEDIFCDTYLKVYEKIYKYGIKDDTDKGFENYMFIAFKINTLREGQYSRNARRDDNVVNLGAHYEAYLKSKLTSEEKLLSDLKKDFSTLYLMKVIEDNFDNESFYLFRVKTFSNMTYKELAEYTGLKGVRQKVVDCKNYLKQHVTKEEIDKAFNVFNRNFL